jgi:hypothetical protein
MGAYALEHADPAALLENSLRCWRTTTSDEGFATVICGSLDASSAS